MPAQSVIVWDLETVPDLGGFAAANDLIGKSDVEVREAPGKPKGFDGGEVERYFREGKIKEIADYCETDVVGTYQVWLRCELFRGLLSQDAFEATERNLGDFLQKRAEKPSSL